MKIISFRAANIKKVKVVEITPSGAMVRVTGANGSGKSSTLDAIYYTLAGVASIPSNPIRDGEEAAEVSLKLGVDGVLKYKVTRKFSRGKTSSVVVEPAEGARFTSPQALLDRLFGSLTFDPEVFGRMSPKEQLNQLKALVKLDVDVDALDAQNRADFDNRTEVNRRVKQLKESVDLYAGGVQPDMDVAPIEVGDLLRQIEQASAQDAARTRIRNGQDAAEKAVRDQLAAIEILRRDLASAENALENLRQTRDEKNKVIAPPAVDVAALTRQVQDATRENSARDLQRQQREKHATAVGAHRLAVEQSDALSLRIEERSAQKRAAIAAAKMPVDGLSLGDTEVLFNGIPFNQIANGDRIRIQCEIAASLSPELKIIRIQNGSLLDSANREAIATWALEKGYQVFVEEVDETGTVGIYLEDGEVVAVDGVAVVRDPAGEY